MINQNHVLEVLCYEAVLLLSWINDFKNPGKYLALISLKEKKNVSSPTSNLFFRCVQIPNLYLAIESKADKAVFRSTSISHNTIPQSVSKASSITVIVVVPMSVQSPPTSQDLCHWAVQISVNGHSLQAKLMSIMSLICAKTNHSGLCCFGSGPSSWWSSRYLGFSLSVKRKMEIFPRDIAAVCIASAPWTQNASILAKVLLWEVSPCRTQ